MRNVVVTLPEDLMLRLLKRAKDEQLTTHELAADVLTDWLEA